MNVWWFFLHPILATKKIVFFLNPLWREFAEYETGIFFKTGFVFISSTTWVSAIKVSPPPPSDESDGSWASEKEKRMHETKLEEKVIQIIYTEENSRPKAKGPREDFPDEISQPKKTLPFSSEM